MTETLSNLSTTNTPPSDFPSESGSARQSVTASDHPENDDSHNNNLNNNNLNNNNLNNNNLNNNDSSNNDSSNNDSSNNDSSNSHPNNSHLDNIDPDHTHSDTSDFASDPVDATSTPLGQLLREKREKGGWTIEEVATELKMTVSKLRSLESDDFDQMSVSTYVIGYIRTYARWLNLPADQVEGLVDVYRNQYMKEPVSSEAPVIIKEPLENFRAPAWTASVLVSVLLLSAVVGGFVFWQKHQAKASATTQTPAAKDEAKVEQIEPSVRTAVLAQEIPVQQAAVENSEENVVSSEENVVSSEENAFAESELENTEPASENSSVQLGTSSHSATFSSVVSTNTALRSLVLDLVADSWMEVRDGEGNRNYTGVKKAGQQLVLNNLVAPISLHLGNARGVVVLVDGKDFPINPKSHQDSLRVTIPRAKL